MRKVHARRALEKHMVEAEESSVKLHFTNTSRDMSSREVPAKLST